MKYRSENSLTKSKFEMKNMKFKIIVKVVIATLKLIQLYEKQQKHDDVEIIRQLESYKREIERKKRYVDQQIELNR